MAQKVITKYTDDLDGSEASGSVDFGLDGKSYEIDLSDENASKLRDVFAPYVAAARRSGGGRRQVSTAPRGASSGRSREETGAMRTWLRENGYSVKDRGRVPAELIGAYESKTPAPKQTVDVELPAEDGPGQDRQSNTHAVEFQSA